MEPSRELFWHINGQGIMYFFTALSLAFFLIGVYQKIAGWRLGRKGIESSDLGLRVKSLIWYILTHDKTIFMRKSRRIMHLGIFFGFLILLFGTIVVGIQADFGIHIFYGNFYLILSFLLDLAGLAAIYGIVTAAYKRFQKKPDSEITFDDVFLLGLVFAILFSGFILEGLRISATNDPWAIWTPVGLILARFSQLLGLSASFTQSAYIFMWYAHMLLGLGFIAYLPYSKLFHLFVAPLNIFFRPLQHKGVLSTGELTKAGGNLGVRLLPDFRRKQLMELDACVSCGRCQKHCPAHAEGGPLSPEKLTQDLKKHLRNYQSPFRKTEVDSSIGSILSQKALWACTTCGLCEKKCPVQIEHINRIVDLRRGQVGDIKQYPSQLEQVVSNIAKTGNPWGAGDKEHISANLQIPQISRDKPVEFLYWLGCFGAYDNRNKHVTEAMFSILHKAGVEFATLGMEEKCCGHSVRRLGQEELFQRLAKENIQTLNKYSFKSIVTHCPHCYHTLKNEYPQFGGNFKVLHHSELIAELIEAGKIIPRSINSKVTFHDPCYLGRFNNVYDAPRKVLSSIPSLELEEMKNNRSMSICCGGGGGVWLEDQQHQQMGILRAREAAKLKPDILATACSSCLTQLTKAANDLEAPFLCKDIAEIIADAI